jgi:uncharacterized protein
MHTRIAPHADAIEALCRRLGVKRLELFGSAATSGFESGRSDYDFLVELDPAGPGSRAQRIIDLAEALELLLGARVDLVNPRYIRNPYFAAEVERTRTPIYGEHR